MDEFQTGQSLTSLTANTPVASVREKSTEDLTRAIHSPHDEGYTLDRTRVMLKLYYDPDMDAADRASMIDSYARALRFQPRWAVAQAFDEWERTGKRRPSPGELVWLATEAVDRLRKEVQYRDRMAALPRPYKPTPMCEAEKARTNEILSRAGFTPKRFEAVRAKPMAVSRDELEAAETAPRRAHWSELVAPDSPEIEALRKARDANPLIRQARLATVAK